MGLFGKKKFKLKIPLLGDLGETALAAASAALSGISLLAPPPFGGILRLVSDSLSWLSDAIDDEGDGGAKITKAEWATFLKVLTQRGIEEGVIDSDVAEILDEADDLLEDED